MNIVMTKVSMPIIGWVSEILGWMINVIYSGLELIGITILQIERCDAAGDPENPEEIQW